MKTQTSWLQIWLEIDGNLPFDQTCSESAKFETKVSRELARVGPNLVETKPSSVKFAASLAERERCWPKLVQERSNANFGPVRSNLAESKQNLAGGRMGIARALRDSP